MKLGQTILKNRQARGLSQEKLAELVGVSRQAVSKWEVGDAIPDTDKLIPLARALNITVDELLGNIPEEEEDVQEAAEPPVSGQYIYAQIEPAPAPEKKPGWFATHWYWLGLIPAIWGTWQLLKLLGMLLLILVNISAPGHELAFESYAAAEEVEVVEIPAQVFDAEG